MTTDHKLKIIFGILSIGLFTTLLFKLTEVPGGMILSGLFLVGMMLVGIILGCLILTGILNLDKNLVGFNPSTFFGKSIGDGNAIRSLSFKIVPDNKTEEKYYTLDWMDKVDKKLILLQDPAKGISNEAIEVKIEK